MTRSMSAARGYIIRRCRPFPALREYGPEVKGRSLSDDDRPGAVTHRKRAPAVDGHCVCVNNKQLVAIMAKGRESHIPFL